MFSDYLLIGAVVVFISYLADKGTWVSATNKAMSDIEPKSHKLLVEALMVVLLILIWPLLAFSYIFPRNRGN